MTQTEIEARVAGLDDATAAKVICALAGHSRVQEQFFGYWNCARCGQQVGDSLGGSYSAHDVVAVGHHCDTCRENVKTLDWKDTLRLPPEATAYLTVLADEPASRAAQHAAQIDSDRWREDMAKLERDQQERR